MVFYTSPNLNKSNVYMFNSTLISLYERLEFPVMNWLNNLKVVRKKKELKSPLFFSFLINNHILFFKDESMQILIYISKVYIF